MRYLSVGLGVAVMAMLGLVGFVLSRRNVVLQLNKTSYFESVKHKVSSDMLKEVKTNIAEANIRLERTKKQIADLTTALKTAQEAAVVKKAEMNKCNDEMVRKGMDLGFGGVKDRAAKLAGENIYIMFSFLVASIVQQY